jgi:hypothetical protein
MGGEGGCYRGVQNGTKQKADGADESPNVQAEGCSTSLRQRQPKRASLQFSAFRQQLMLCAD